MSIPQTFEALSAAAHARRKNAGRNPFATTTPPLQPERRAILRELHPLSSDPFEDRASRIIPQLKAWDEHLRAAAAQNPEEPGLSHKPQPRILIHLLSRKYHQVHLRILHGHDSAEAKVLQRACSATGFHLLVAQFERAVTGTTATLDESDFQADKSWIDDVWETECGLSKVAYAGQEGKVRVKRVPEVSEDDMLDLGYWRRARDGTRARHTGAGRQGEEMYSRTALVLMAPSIAPKYIDREDLERITGQKFEDYASATDSEAEDMATEKYVDDKLRERRESREQESSAGGGKRIADDEENNESPSKNV